MQGAQRNGKSLVAERRLRYLILLIEVALKPVILTRQEIQQST